MGRKIPFVKMQGAGNDYVYVSLFGTAVENPEDLARKISDRHFGVGSDGLVLLCPSDKADIRMRMFNADGTEAEMCGNASRCVAKLAWDRGLVKKQCFSLETGAGIKPIELHFAGDAVESVTVDMGEPILEAEAIPYLPPKNSVRPLLNIPVEIDGQSWGMTPVSMGNPHAVVFCEDIDQLDLRRLGPLFETHPDFPRKTNTEFVEIVTPDKLRMRVWERGAGETLACGTGACATLVASALNGLSAREAVVEVLGGELGIKWDERNNHVYMSGPAETVFEGVYHY